MDNSKNPFPTKAPKFIRSKLYKYHFTTDISGVNWWTRSEIGEYSPPISKVGVKIRMLKVDFKTGGTWRWVGQ